MKVLMITGDKKFGTGNPRFELQKSTVDELAVVYWGRENKRPTIPERNFDVVTVQDPFWRGLFAWRAARRLKAKFNVQVHTDFAAQTRHNAIRRVVGCFVLRRADSIRVVTERIKEQVQQIAPLVPVRVLPVFVDVGQVRAALPADMRAQYPQFKKIILWAGRLEPEKNPCAAVKLLPDVLQALPETGLLIAGEGSELELLKNLAKKLGVEKNVIFLGYRSDIYSFYKSADVLLVTSWYESFGAAMVEALAAGCVVVSPDVGVAKEAGAHVVERKDLAKEVVRVLQTSGRGVLKLQLLDKEAWAQVWRETLI